MYVTMFTKLQKHYSAQKYPRRLQMNNNLVEISSDNTEYHPHRSVHCITLYVTNKRYWFAGD